MKGDLTSRRWLLWVGAAALIVTLGMMVSPVWAAELQVDYWAEVTSNLSYDREYIGYNGVGTLNHTSSTPCTNAVTEALYLGYSLTATGTYLLGGGGSLSAVNQYIGYNGTGTVKQTGGDNKISNTLYLGTNFSATGTYELSGGSLSADIQYIGYQGTGTLKQTGGGNGAHNLYVGYVGYGTSGSGTYYLQGGTLAAQNITINPNGALYMSRSAMKFGNFSNYGRVSLEADAYAINVYNTLNNGTLDMSGSALLLCEHAPLVNNASMSGFGTIRGSGIFTNNALFTQEGGNFTLSNTGANENYGTMDLAQGRLFTLGAGATLTNRGSLNLDNAGVNGDGALINTSGGAIAGPGIISSSFHNTGGVLTVPSGTTSITQPFSNSGLIQLTSFTANLTGGNLTNAGTIQGFGSVGNNVSNTGIIEALGGTLAFTGAMVTNDGGLMTARTDNQLLMVQGMAANAGVINLTGGTFNNNNHPLNNTGQISGYGTFRTGGLSNSGTMTLSGGTTTVQGDLTNQYSCWLNISYNPAIFTGDVVNYGIVKTTATTVTWAGRFENHGTYISDPSTQSFGDLEVGEEGYLVGASQDLFIVANDFINQSTKNKAWDSAEATLRFAHGADTIHKFYLAGADLGAGMAGYNNNFAWGTLDIAGQIVHLFDGNDTPGGAMYVGEILGLDLGGSVINNIFGHGLNIYYDPTLPGNEYLEGRSYAFLDGGGIVPTPVPASVLLLGSGLLGLGLLGWRRRKS